MKIINLGNKKYNRLTILREYKSNYSNGHPVRRLECLCDCGNISNPVKMKVIKGFTKSCGCLKKEMEKIFNIHNKLPNGDSAKNEVFQTYRKSARLRGYDFNLTIEEFVNIATKPCFYCGNTLTNTFDRRCLNGDFKYTGIDRYDNNKGYTVKNSVPCCSVCNRIKTNMDTKTLFIHLKNMIKNHNIWRRSA